MPGDPRIIWGRILSLAPSMTWQEITEAINKHLGTMKVKEVTLKLCREVVDATVNGGP